MFTPLPPATIERLALSLVPLNVHAGAVIIRKGETGDRFYVVAEGATRVEGGGPPVILGGAGASFGEIALLRDVPRTATVTASTDMALFALGRDAFLEAVTGHPRSLAAADEAIRDRTGS
jgi:CRP-like cAMP-binding protein